MNKEKAPHSEEEINEAVAALFDEMLKDGTFVWVTDEDGNQVFRSDGLPAFSISPLGLNKHSGMKELN